MVAQFEISNFCLISFPCKHDCKITLLDGRTKAIRLNSTEIYSLITSVAKKKIIGPTSHFQEPIFTAKQTTNQILTELFHDTV